MNYEEVKKQKAKIQQLAGNLLHEKITNYIFDHPTVDYGTAMHRILDKDPELKKQYTGI